MAITPDLFGPYGLLAGALVVIGILWRLHLEGDKRDRADRDAWQRRWEAADRRLSQLSEILGKAKPQ